MLLNASVCPQGRWVCLEGLHGGEEGLHEGGLHGRGQTPHTAKADPRPATPRKDTTGYGQQAGSTHPTGMHSCFYTSLFLEKFGSCCHLLKNPDSCIVISTQNNWTPSHKCSNSIINVLLGAKDLDLDSNQ